MTDHTPNTAASASPESAASLQLPRAQVLRNRWKLIGILLVFILPVFFAYAGYFGGWFQNYARSNRGELLTPVPQIGNWQWQFNDGRTFETGGKWWLVYVHRGDACDASCQLQLYTLQQTWIGIGKDQDRVRIGALGVAPDVKLPEQAERLNASVEALNQNQVSGPAYYVIDPLGNVVLRYLAPSQQQDAIERSKDIRKDFQKLLRFSHIG
ncbi:hypothetical protein HPT27_07745 [Permianibacter sp. IMCC34836]|uniref:hypothetical protein n=1 Tax=Permianibacter fluminis TaxID=2738515 RepID=UPI001555CAAD|nr:hypothetical protein [Permianibacter fluminis]NQD36917.1 hypothetical protein [Permianibacter fluminis]